jgi:hypothetical protein
MAQAGAVLLTPECGVHGASSSSGQRWILSREARTWDKGAPLIAAFDPLQSWRSIRLAVLAPEVLHPIVPAQ